MVPSALDDFVESDRACSADGECLPDLIVRMDLDVDGDGAVEVFLANNGTSERAGPLYSVYSPRAGGGWVLLAALKFQWEYIYIDPETRKLHILEFLDRQTFDVVIWSLAPTGWLQSSRTHYDRGDFENPDPVTEQVEESFLAKAKRFHQNTTAILTFARARTVERDGDFYYTVGPWIDPSTGLPMPGLQAIDGTRGLAPEVEARPALYSDFLSRAAGCPADGAQVLFMGKDLDGDGQDEVVEWPMEDFLNSKRACWEDGECVPNAIARIDFDANGDGTKEVFLANADDPGKRGPLYSVYSPRTGGGFDLVAVLRFNDDLFYVDYDGRKFLVKEPAGRDAFDVVVWTMASSGWTEAQRTSYQRDGEGSAEVDDQFYTRAARFRREATIIYSVAKGATVERDGDFFYELGPWLDPATGLPIPGLPIIDEAAGVAPEAEARPALFADFLTRVRGCSGTGTEALLLWKDPDSDESLGTEYGSSSPRLGAASREITVITPEKEIALSDRELRTGGRFFLLETSPCAARFHLRFGWSITIASLGWISAVFV